MVSWRCYRSKRLFLSHLRVHLRLALYGFRGVVGVLSVAKLTLGQEAYYEQQVVRGLDDYYAGRGESPGIWAGRGAAALGLSGVVEDGELGTLLRGVNPATEERLRAPVRERTITVRTLDLDTGRWVEEKALRPVAGFDLVFSCPKSVSLLHALTDDERVRREISEAHEASWQAALGYLEREACVVRRGNGGARREHGEGFVAAAFRHRTSSRAQDPHLHTHVIVANMARAEDGKWRALDGEAILQTYRLAAGYLYEAQLRHELTRRLGSVVDGAGEGDGRARARARGGGSRVLDPAAVAGRAHGRAGHRGLRRRPGRRARDPRAQGAGRPAAAARGVAGARRRARARPTGARPARSRAAAARRSRDRS